MKRLTTLTLAFVLLVSLAQAQERDGMMPRVSPNASVKQTVGVTDLTLTYGRPAARDRTLFGAEGSGALEAYGAVWRLGANEATTFTASTDVMVEGQPLAAGTYALFAVPGPERWTFIFNSEANQWGAYDRDAAKDVLSVEVSASEGPHVEQLLLWFEDVTPTSAEVMVGWGTARAGFTVTTDTDNLVMAAGAKAASSADWRMPFRYATYALDRGLDPVVPLTWAEKAVSLNNAYATVSLKARLQAASGNFEAAVATGEAAVALAEAMENTPGNLQMLRDAVEEWRGRMQ